MAILDVLSDIAPELDSQPEDKRERFITRAENQTSEDIFNLDYDLAVANLAAHMMTISLRVGNGGMIESLREGDLAITYGNPLPNANETLETTAYGLEYIRLRELHVFTPVCVTT